MNRTINAMYIKNNLLSRCDSNFYKNVIQDVLDVNKENLLCCRTMNSKLEYCNKCKRYGCTKSKILDDYPYGYIEINCICAYDSSEYCCSCTKMFPWYNMYDTGGNLFYMQLTYMCILCLHVVIIAILLCVVNVKN